MDNQDGYTTFRGRHIFFISRFPSSLNSLFLQKNITEFRVEFNTKRTPKHRLAKIKLKLNSTVLNDVTIVKGRQQITLQTTTRKHDLAVFNSLLNLIPFFLSSAAAFSAL